MSATRYRRLVWYVGGAIRGDQIQVGDSLAPYGPVTVIEPYTGPLAYLWQEGARIVYCGRSGVTVGNDDRFEEE